MNKKSQESSITTTECTDYELLQAFQKGNEHAFVLLYERRRLDAYRFALHMLRGNEDQASDVFQEAFIKVYQNADSFRYGTNVKGWILMIVRNLCLNLLRDEQRTVSIPDDEILEASDKQFKPEAMQEQNLMRESLQKALETLPKDLRDAVILREFEGVSYEEIARMCGTSQGTIRQRIWRAKQQIRKQLWHVFKDGFIAE